MSIHNTYKGWRTSIIGIVFLIFISCTSADEIKYIPKDTTVNDTITNLINNKRDSLFINNLKPEVNLILLSKIKATEMSVNKEINHNGFAYLNVNTENFGEVVGYGYNSNESLFKAYMSSKSHRYIMLGDFTHIGSYTYSGYNCIIFAKY